MTQSALNQGQFTKSSVLVIKLLFVLAKGLSKRRMPEFMMSLYAILYGLAMAVFGTTALTSLNYTPSSLMHGVIPHVYGAMVAFTGAMGMWGLYKHNRSLRLTSAMCLAVTWGGLALHYLFSQPPIQTAFVVHAFHSVMEAVIFLRVFADLDSFWQEIRGK